jgi:hypothetical protein
MTDSKTVDISGLDKMQVLKALWEESKTASFFAMMPKMAPPFSESEAQNVMNSKRPYFDYLSGRVIKTDFTTDQLNPWGYDRDNGKGAMQRVVNSVKVTK